MKFGQKSSCSREIVASRRPMHALQCSRSMDPMTASMGWGNCRVFIARLFSLISRIRSRNLIWLIFVHLSSGGEATTKANSQGCVARSHLRKTNISQAAVSVVKNRFSRYESESVKAFLTPPGPIAPAALEVMILYCFVTVIAWFVFSRAQLVDGCVSQMFVLINLTPNHYEWRWLRMEPTPICHDYFAHSLPTSTFICLIDGLELHSQRSKRSQGKWNQFIARVEWGVGCIRQSPI